MARNMTYSPCKSCGSQKVERSISMSVKDGKDLVLVDCAYCGNRRSRYYRKKQQRVKYDDIPQFIWGGNYAVDLPWRFLEGWLESQNETGQLDLDPDFQRGHVWTNDKRVAYVEYIMRGGQSSKSIWFNCKGWPSTINQPVVLVDGKQRLESVRLFLRNKLRVFPELRKGGLLLSDFEDKRPPMGWSFRIHVNNLETRAEVLEWYLQMNSGGVVHTQEELDRVRKLLEEEA